MKRFSSISNRFVLLQAERPQVARYRSCAQLCAGSKGGKVGSFPSASDTSIRKSIKQSTIYLQTSMDNVNFACRGPDS